MYEAVLGGMSDECPLLNIMYVHNRRNDNGHMRLQFLHARILKLSQAVLPEVMFGIVGRHMVPMATFGL